MLIINNGYPQPRTDGGAGRVYPCPLDYFFVQILFSLCESTKSWVLDFSLKSLPVDLEEIETFL